MGEVLKYVKLTSNAYAPNRSSNQAAGIDLKAAYDGRVPKRGSTTVCTDLGIEFPNGTYGRIAGRSGLALHNQIVVGGGVIDPDYRGNIKIILINHGDVDFCFEKGDRIAQLICEKICFPVIEEVAKLSPTQRQSQGFGSTGIK